MKKCSHFAHDSRNTTSDSFFLPSLAVIGHQLPATEFPCTDAGAGTGKEVGARQDNYKLQLACSILGLQAIQIGKTQIKVKVICLL